MIARVAAIWIVSDGKPGHLNQSLGLAEALQRLRPNLEIATLSPLARRDLLALLVRRAPRSLLPDSKPAALLCAGHATHLTTLLLARYCAASSVVMMRPSLPLSWFDYALLPCHDHPPQHSKLLQTEGALNRMQPAAKRPDSGVILLGGASRHYHWDEPQLVAKVAALVGSDQRHWQLSGSRRTPASTLNALAALNLPNLQICLLESQPDGWLVDQLSHSERCWVSCDSVSMVYEALTAGCNTGLFALPEKGGKNRLAEGIKALRASGQVAWFDGALPPPLNPAPALAEAERAASWLLSHGLLT